MTGRLPFLRHRGVAAPLLADNIDTDQIIPSREMKAVSREGLGGALFAGWRYLSPGGREENPDFILNRPAYRQAAFLLGGRNFGCGSSREHAVWALKVYGVLAIIAPSFGEIFLANCIRNGLLPVVADADLVARLARLVAEDPRERLLTVDLPAQRVSIAGGSGLEFSFDIDAYSKRLLTEGLDPIGLTLSRRAEIDAFLAADAAERPWIYGSGEGG